MTGPFEPPRHEGLNVTCNERDGTLAIVGVEVVFRPISGEPTALAIRDLVVVTGTHGGRYSIGLPAAIFALLGGAVLRAPVEVMLALSSWIGLIVWGVGTQLFPDVRFDVEAKGAAWKLTSHDAGLAPLARDLRRRMASSSLRTTAVEMLSDSARTLVWPGPDFPWHRRALAAWMVTSLPGPTLLAVLAVAWATAHRGGSGLVAGLAGLGFMGALGQVALLPGLLLQIPMMGLLRRSGLAREGVSSPPPEDG